MFQRTPSPRSKIGTAPQRRSTFTKTHSIVLCFAAMLLLWTTNASAQVAIPRYGNITISPAILPSGAEQPFRTSDCDSDGDMDLEIAWSLAPNPVNFDLVDVFPGGLPTQFTLEVLTDNAVLRAFDVNGVQQDIVAAGPTFEAQTLTVEYPNGIAFATLEGTQMCVLEVCSFRPAQQPIIRGDANDDGAVNIADVVNVLGYVFGTNGLPCLASADANASGTLDISDGVFLIEHLFGTGVIPAPFPNCGADPTPTPMLCLSYTSCPSNPDETICVGSPEIGVSGFGIALRSGILEPGEGLDVAGILASSQGIQPFVHFLVQADTMPLDTNALENFEVFVQDFVGDNTYTAVADLTTVASLQALPGVRWAGPLTPELKMDPALQGGEIAQTLPWAVAPNGDIGINVYFHPDLTPNDVTTTVQNNGGTIVAHVPEALLCQITIPDWLIRELAAAEELQFLEPMLPPLEPTNDAARTLANVDPLQQFPYDLTGSGITVAVYDSGNVDSNHPDFGNRVIEVESPLEGGNGHATHVAGTIGGSGIHSTSDGGTPRQFAGVAPGVEIRSYGYGLHLNPLFDNPGDLLSNIRGSSPTHLANMSLGNNVVLNGFSCRQLGVYTTTARVVDAIVLGEPAASGGSPEPSIPFVMAAGNERQMGAPCGQFGTIGSPATSKNSITVGSLDGTGVATLGSSSLGPTDDGRIRPDLMALGCTTSTDLGNSYGGRCGTSMASPVVAGVAALILEEWAWLHQPDIFDPATFPPHTLKALLIHTAVDLGPVGPDYTFGWGRVNAQEAVDLLRADFVETSMSGPLIYQGEVDPLDSMFQAEFDSDGMSEQKFTLVWDDPLPSSLAALSLVNNLDLRVVAPNGVTYRPWLLDPTDVTAPATTGLDRLNNVEQVVAPAMAGIWNVFVDATSLPTGANQPFTLIREPSVQPSDCVQEIRKTVELTPPWTGSGDRDFDGNGPAMEASGFLDVRDLNEVWLTFDVEANETDPDFTAAAGQSEYLVYYDPDVSSVSLSSPPFDSLILTTSSHLPTTVSLGTGGLFRQLTFFGDSDGPEAGYTTRVRMITNPIEISCTTAPFTSKKQVFEVDRVFFQPPHVLPGDNDFDGNGPFVSLFATLAIGGPGNTQLIATITMDAEETNGGDTMASGSQEFVVYTSPVPIASILSDTSSSAFYTDIDHIDDRPMVSGLVREFRVIGDSDGADAGVRTGVEVDFNPIRIMEQ